MAEPTGFQIPVQPPIPSERGPVPPPQRSFGQRLLAALRLDATVYEEVEHDPRALPQAAAVVGLAALAAALGAFGVVGVGAILGGLLGAFVSWMVWTALVWLIGVKLLAGRADFEELLRTIGFVAAPQLLYALAIIPLPFWQALVALVVLGMTLAAFVRAVQHALDVSLGRALVTALAAVAAQLLLVAAFGALLRAG